MTGAGRFVLCLLLISASWVLALRAAHTMWSVPVAVAAFLFGLWLVGSERGRA